jgi:hypothetical protein
MKETGAALRRLVGDDRRFAEAHWGRRPLLRRAAGDFAALLDLPDVDHLVTETLLRLPAVRLVKDGTPIPASTYTRSIRVGSQRVEGTVRPDRVLSAFDDGATIVLQALHRQWPPVARFCRDLELDLTHPVQANAYVTPATAKGFALHHDTHDVFVIQTHGRKEWRVYAPLVELAGPEQKWSRSMGDPGRPLVEAELNPGDVMYIPRGFPHDAAAREEVSIHVTVGVLTRTWLDVWRHLMDQAPDHAPFREALPIGFARDADALAAQMTAREAEFRAWFEKQAGGESARSFVRGFWEKRRPILGGQLVTLARLGRVDAETPFRVRPGSVFEVWAEEDEAVVLLGGRELRMPRFCERDLRFLAETHGPVSATDLPGELDLESRVTLLTRLLKEGAVEVVDAAG